MALNDPRIVFGIHSFTAFNRSTFMPYGPLALVLGGSTYSLGGELVGLNGGSAKYEWAVEDGIITAELSLKMKEYPKWVFELFLGKALTENAAETSGSVTALTDRFGGSVVDATTGIASVSLLAGSTAELKFGYYTVQAASATTVHVYGMTNVDFAAGTDLTYQDDTLKITASALTIATGADVTVPSLGVKFTGGSGAIAMTTGHTATFKIRPANTLSADVTVGATNDIYPEFGALMIAQRRGGGQMFEIEAFRCKGLGSGFGFEEKAFSETEVTAKSYFDSARGGVFAYRDVISTGT